MSSAEKRPAQASRVVVDQPHAPERAPAQAPAAPRKTNTPPPGLSSAPDMASLMGALRRRWLLALTLGLTLACATTAALWYFLPARYTAFSFVRVMLRPDVFWDRGEGGRDFLAFLKTQEARMKSRDVLLKVLADDKVRFLPLFTQKPDPQSRLTFLDEELKIVFFETSELMQIQFIWDDPDVAVKVVDAVTRAYIERANKEETRERATHTKQIKELYKAQKKKIADKQLELDGLAKQFSSPDPADLASERMMRASEYLDAKKLYTEASLELQRTKQQEKQLERNLKNLDGFLAAENIDEAVNSHPSVKELEAKAEIPRARVKRMDLGGYRSDEFVFVRARETLAGLEQALAQRKQEIRDALLKGLRKKLEFDFNQKLQEIREELPPLVERQKKLEDGVKLLAQDTATTRIGSSKVDFLKKEIATEDEVLKNLAGKLKERQAEETAEPRVRQEQEATWQDKDAKRRILILAGGFLGTFFLAALGVSYMDFRSRRIHSAREVMVGLNLKVLGEVPNWPRAGRGRLIGPDEGPPGPDRPSLIESIDGIRTLLLRGAGELGSPVVMVTSAVEGEGKTTLAANLALSVARSGRKTLLVDCDLRRPSAHQLFEQTLQPGFSELVLGEVDLGSALRPTTTEHNLWLLPAGQWDRAVVQELARNGVSDLFAQMRAEFDFIVLDSHPLLPATDSLLIGQHVDGVIVSLLHDVSQTPKVYAACQRLETLGIPCFGAVVNGTTSSSY